MGFSGATQARGVGEGRVQAGRGGWDPEECKTAPARGARWPE